MTRRSVGVICLVLGLAGCGNDAVPVGDECDAAAARTPYFRASDGQPAYPGQAYLIATCSQCHSDRTGRTAGLDIDLRLVATGLDDAARQREAEHLLAAQQHVYSDRDEIYGQVVHRNMPPGGVSTIPPYRDAAGTALPDLRSEEGEESLRNWLACGAPVVESTEAHPEPCAADDECPVTGQCDLAAGECVRVGDVIPAAD